MGFWDMFGSAANTIADAFDWLGNNSRKIYNDVSNTVKTVNSWVKPIASGAGVATSWIPGVGEFFGAVALGSEAIDLGMEIIENSVNGGDVLNSIEKYSKDISNTARAVGNYASGSGNASPINSASVNRVQTGTPIGTIQGGNQNLYSRSALM